MQSAPSLEHAARFGRGRLGRRVHETPVGRHNHEARVRPICQQHDGFEQPAPVEGGEKANEPEESAEESGSLASRNPAYRPASTRPGVSGRRAEGVPAAPRR
jgi:hypothetical protein